VKVRSLAPSFSFAMVVALAAACSDQSLSSPPVSPPARDGGVADAEPAVDAGTKRPGVIRVATLNTHRFFDTTCASGSCAASDYEAVLSPATFDAVATKLAQGIALIDPDVIALEEVETQACLDALLAKLRATGHDFPIAHLGETGSAGSVDVAILARGTLGSVLTHRQTPLQRPDGTSTTFSRELLEIRMTFGARQVVMFGAHFRSQVDDDPGRRLAEAKATHDIMGAVATELPDALVVLGGDLNDRPGSPPILALEAGGTLVRVAQDVPVEAQGTYLFDGKREALDHVFVVSGQAKRYVPMSATVYRDDERGFAGSDHAALAADFAIE
jgi:uncharacterized protein